MSEMRIGLVHDYLKEFGGAERVLVALSEVWPKAPIHTAFYCSQTAIGQALEGREVKESFLAPILKRGHLYSPLRFLAPIIWKSFNFRDYDLVLTSASWYVTRGFRVGPQTKVICYCHTPPRWLYGYETSVEWQRFWPIRLYGQLVAHGMRFYDYQSAQKVDWFIANSKNVQARIKKFYRRDSTVIYPPVRVKEIASQTKKTKPEDFYLIVSRVVGAKGIELAIEAAQKAGFKLKIVGERAGLAWLAKKLKGAGDKIEFLGRLPDKKLYQMYGRCRAFLALAADEDFGITPVEAMAAGRPVIAFRGGGYQETVVEGKTGLFFDRRTPDGLVGAIKEFEKNEAGFKPVDCRAQARRFSEARFKKELSQFVAQKMGGKNA